MAKGYCRWAVWLVVVPVHAQVFSWTDEHGHRQFSDRQPEGREFSSVDVVVSPPMESDTLANTLKYALMRDRERMKEQRKARKVPREAPSPPEKNTGRSLKWKPAMHW